MNLTQEQIEAELSDAIPYGMREEIAKGTGIYPKIVDAYFNSNDERKSPHFTMLHIQAVLDRKNLEVGEKVWQTVNAIRDLGVPHNFKRHLEIVTETARGIKEDADVAIAAFEELPLYTQLVEINQAIAQKQRQKQAIVEKIAQQGSEASGGFRRTGTR